MPTDPVPAVPTKRRLAQLGGTTSWSDAATALGLLHRADQLLDGPALPEYEAAFAARAGGGHGISFSAGRVALHSLLRALRVGPGDEVLVQVPTHVVVANAIRYVGAVPVFVDCRLDSYDIDLEEAARQVTARTRVLVLQHTFGIPADIDAALRFGQEHGLEVVEDCVHALGSTYRGRPVGSFGRAAFFSTEETKTISTTMGGMAVTADDELAARLREIQQQCAWPAAGTVRQYLVKLAAYHAATQPSVHRGTRPVYELLGRRNPLPGPTTAEELRGGRPERYEVRLSNAQALLGLRQLHRLDENLAHRRRIARAYERELGQRGFGPPRPPDGADPAYVRYPVWTGDRSRAVARLRPHTVPGLWFTSVLEEAVSPVALGYVPGSCPRAEAAATHLVNLPTHLRVREADVEVLAAALHGLAPARASKEVAGV